LMLSEPILVVERLVRAFDDLGIPYLVGGSLASSFYGIPRATQDVDLVAGIKQLGDKISGRQWKDILGVLEIQGETLDRGYLATGWEGS